tara:strand:+ start:295 stop:720 length:426 start_codon:yes stop_codon:yes gene_type:complete
MLLLMGNTLSINKINFEDMQEAIKNNYIIINTLNKDRQDCTITNTLSVDNEVSIINTMLTNGKLDKYIILYGENSADNSIYPKYKQLFELGFSNIYIYVGGLFEWLLLQDIYGCEMFPTSKKEPDHLRYKGCKKMNIKLIE